jgi:hypothetical protein
MLLAPYFVKYIIPIKQGSNPSRLREGIGGEGRAKRAFVGVDSSTSAIEPLLELALPLIPSRTREGRREEQRKG